MVPFYRSYLLNGRTIYLDKLSELSDSELKLLNVVKKKGLKKYLG